jgi:alpha-beta hydrolase superfamily lysophospholipase
MNITKKLAVVVAALAFAGLGCDDSAPTTEAQELALELDQEALRLSLGNGTILDVDFDYGRLNLEEMFTTSTGRTVRYKTYNYLGRTEAYVIFLNGRTEFIEKHEPLFTANYEMPWETSAAQTLADLPITFVSMDHEGQGKASGLKSHIDTYDTYVENLHAVIQRLGLDKKDGRGRKRTPVYLMSHSMGGLIGTRYAQAHPENIDGLILSSPLLGVNAPAGISPAQLRQLTDAYSFAFGMADRCARAVDPQVLGLLAMCLADTTPETTCGPCFLDPNQDSCFFAPYNMPLEGETLVGLRGAWGFLQSNAAIGCQVEPVNPEYVCTVTSEGFWGTTSDYDYCTWTDEHPLSGPNQTFGWISQTFLAIDALNANMDIIRNFPTLVLSAVNDPIVTESAHDLFCEQMSNCTMVKFESNWETGPLYFHELLAEADRAAAVSAIRNFLGERLGL